MSSNIKFVKIGNSLSVRIPKGVADILHISEGNTAELFVRGKELILRPKHTYILKDLLSGISGKNLHSELPTGKDVGREVIVE